MSTDIMIEFKGSTDNIETIEDAVNTSLAIEQQGYNFYLEEAGTSTYIAAKDILIISFHTKERRANSSKKRNEYRVIRRGFKQLKPIDQYVKRIYPKRYYYLQQTGS